jgi:hypothetical protein
VNSIPQDFWTLTTELATKCERHTEVKEEVKELLRLVDRHIMPLLEDFRLQTSKTFRFWDMFLTAIEIMLQNIRSEREGLWTAHLISVSAIYASISFHHKQ